MQFMVICGVLACCIQLHGMEQKALPEQKKSRHQSLQDDDQLQRFPDRVARVIQDYAGFDVYASVHTRNSGICALSSDLTYIATGTGSTIALWNAATGSKLYEFFENTGIVHALAFSDDGKMLVSGGADRIVRTWNCQTGEFMRQYDGHTGAIYALAFSPDGSTIASSGWDNDIRLWDATSICVADRKVPKIPHGCIIKKLEFSPQSTHLGGVCNNGVGHLWDCKTRKEVYRRKGLSINDAARTLVGNRVFATKNLAYWGQPGDDDEPLRPMKFSHDIERLALSPDDYVAAACGDCVCVADCKTRETVQYIWHGKQGKETLSVFFKQPPVGPYAKLAIAGAGCVTFYRRLCLPVCNDVPSQGKQS
jgi:WD40 repeat protein